MFRKATIPKHKKFLPEKISFEALSAEYMIKMKIYTLNK